MMENRGNWREALQPRDPLTGHDADCACETCIDAYLVHALATDPEPRFAEQLQAEAPGRGSRERIFPVAWAVGLLGAFAAIAAISA